MKKLLLSNNEFALVDNEDHATLAKHKWSVSRNGYVYRNSSKDGKAWHVSLARFIMSFPKDTVDHIDGNKLDNRKENLRVCLFKDNNKNRCMYKNNTSGYKGVCRFKDLREKPWMASIGVDKKNIYLGIFKTREQASDVYNKAAKRYFGEFERLGN